MDARASIAHRIIIDTCAANVACFQMLDRQSVAQGNRALAATVSQIANHREPRAALITSEFGFHFPEGYIYAALASSDAVEGLNMHARLRRKQPPR